MDDKDMLYEQVEADNASEAATGDNGDEDESLVIKFGKPYIFDRKEYTEIDLSGMEGLTGTDMIAINKIMARSSAGIDVMPEVSLEYACYFAAKAAKMPVEFFLGLPAKVQMKIKNRVMGFLFGAD